MAIQVLVPKFRTEECLNEIRECLDKSWTGLGFKTQLFEEKWSEYTGLPHSHFINSNTVGLHLSFHLFKTHFGWKDNDEIITTPLTFVSTNHAIVYENLKPVFADVDETSCLDPSSIESRITSRTRAVIYVGLGGNTGRLQEVSQLCKKHGLKLILDAAHMAGTRFNGKHIGPEADVTIFSFQAVKNLPTADAGMICFKEKKFDEECRKLTWLGINKDTYARTTTQGNYKWKYDVEYVGYKYHGNSITASLGLVGLKYLDEDNRYRRQLAQHYKKLLATIPLIKFVEEIEGTESAQHLFQIKVDDRDKLMTCLQENNIFPGVHYRDNTEYKPYAYAAGSCPNAHRISNQVISLPLHLYLTADDVVHICQVIHNYYLCHRL